MDLSENYNVAPTQQILSIIQHDGEKHLEKLSWGLVPFWAKDLSIGNRMINARVESVATKPSFKAAFKYRRGLIPANGFYEWKGEKGNKQPYYITLPSGDLFAFAGLLESWKPKDASEDAPPHKSCAIITTDAASLVRDIHNRMPLILNSSAYDKWLDPKNQNPEELEKLLQDESCTELRSHPVSKQVNRVQNNTPDLIKPI